TAIEPIFVRCRRARRADGRTGLIQMDALFRARYRVVLPITGAAAGEVVEFDVADHYGFPGFARIRHALLFVAVSDEGTWLHKYQAIAVHRTQDGRWASCGDVRLDPAAPKSAQLQMLA